MMAGIEPVLLWTDALVLALLVVVAAFVWWSRHEEHLRAPWRRVAASRSGMVAATVLAFFVAVGLLDSMHYRVNAAPAAGQPGAATGRSGGGEVLSVLDALAEPLRTRTERTFSAPFATHAHARELSLIHI